MMPDPELEKGIGLGRNEGGNFVLSAIEIDASPDEASSRQRVKLARADADFSQKEFPAASLANTPPTPGWAIGGSPRGVTRRAMAAFAEPIPGGLGAIMTVRLHFQSEHAKHVAAHFRVSVTTVTNPTIKD